MSPENNNNPGIGESTKTTFEEKPSFTPSAPIHSVGDSLTDMDGLKALSRETFKDKYVINKPTQKSEPTEEVDDDDDLLGDAGLPPTAEPEPDKDAPETTKKVPSSEPTEEEEVDEDEDEEGDEDELGLEEPVSHKKFLVGRDGERQIRMPRNAVIGLPIDGKIVEMPLQEALNRASDNIHAKNLVATTRTERERVQAERATFEDERQQTYDNYEMLMHLAEHGEPEDVFEFFGLLTQKNPSDIRNKIIQNSLKYYQRMSQMDPQQRQLYDENRRYKFAETQAQFHARSQQRTVQRQQEATYLQQEMEKESLSVDDWRYAADNMIEMRKQGKHTGNVSISDVIQHAVRLKHAGKVQHVIKAFGEKGKVNGFAEEVSIIIGEYEKLNGKRLNEHQALAVVKRVRGLDKKALGESVGKKADRQERTGKIPSQRQKTQKRKLENKGSLTLGDHYHRLYGPNAGR